MAYAPKSQLQEEEQQGPQAPGAPTAPTIAGPSLGSTASLGGSAGNVGTGGLGAQGAQAQGAGAGTGFTNIDRVLGANQGAGKAQREMADQFINKEKGALADATEKFNTGVQSQRFTGYDPKQLTSGVVAGNADAVGQASGLLGKSAYSGPTAIEYKPDPENLKKIAALGNANSVGTTLAQQGGALANYGTGLSAIDTAIYGSGMNAKNTQEIAQTPQALAAQQAASTQAATGQIANITAQNQALQNNLRGSLQSAGNSISGLADARRKANIAAEAKRLGIDPSAVNPNQAGNTYDPSQMNALRAIGSVLGNAGWANTANPQQIYQGAAPLPTTVNFEPGQTPGMGRNSPTPKAPKDQSQTEGDDSSRTVKKAKVSNAPAKGSSAPVATSGSTTATVRDKEKKKDKKEN